MHESRYDAHLSEEDLYSSISQFLYNENEIFHYSKIENKCDVGNYSVIDIEKENLEQKIMADQENANFNEPYSSSNSSKENEESPTRKTEIIEKQRKNFKNKESKNKFYARNYREKKKEKLKSLEEENRFLKEKIDDLTFRLKETEIELTRLKHSNQPYHPSTFQSTRESLLKQINEMMTKENLEVEKLSKLEKELKELSGFDSKHKMDLLNYFMSELLENLISDLGFYFSDSLISEKGLWKLDSTGPGRQIDYEICELLGLQNFERIKKVLYSIPNFSLSHLINFKKLWKNLYKDYLNIVNQGNLIKSLFKPFFERKRIDNPHPRVLVSLKLELYFERIKYRKDMRELRQSWFEEIKFEKEENEAILIET